MKEVWNSEAMEKQFYEESPFLRELTRAQRALNRGMTARIALQVRHDPWGDAVRWIEARREAEAEWPWPRREDYDVRSAMWADLSQRRPEIARWDY